jgi:hypothetical protein
MAASAVQGVITPRHNQRGLALQGGNGHKHYNYKHNNYATMLLAVTDATRMYICIRTGIPGTVPDLRAWEESFVFQQLLSNAMWDVRMLLPGGTTPVRPYLLVDSAFSSYDFALKLYG